MAGGTPKYFGNINAPVDEGDRILATPDYSAYLRIAEGCDNHCAYCVIPSLRGKYRSRPMAELLDEAAELSSAGVKELLVIAQDITRYGVDLYGERRLPELLRELHDRGLQMAVCSNKADEFSRVIVEHYFPGIFRLVRGNIPGTPVKPDPGVAKGIMERLGAEPGETLMVGDSDVDIHTGHNAGLRACGVTWGFRSRENLVDAGADVLADTTAELKAVILG